MPKIAIIGAGSIVFCKTLILDILATPGLQDSEFALMAPSTRRIPQVAAFVERVIKANDLPASVWITTDRREAVRDADYVIATFQIGGMDAYEADYAIPLRYGVDQCIGDTLGPGGIFRALRSIPVMMDLARDMEALCLGRPCSTTSTRWPWSPGPGLDEGSLCRTLAMACRRRWT